MIDRGRTVPPVRYETPVTHHFPISILIVILLMIPATRGILLQILRNIGLPLASVLILISRISSVPRSER